jgi:hypothetical protein
VLAVGLLCGLGRRTLTRAICFHGRQHQDWSADYKLFNRSRWPAHALFAPVLQTQPRQILCPTHRHRLGLSPGAKRWGKKVKTAFWGRDPLSPPFHANLLWGQRFLQASLLVPLYPFEAESSPRGLPLRFEEVPPVRKPGKKASPEQQAAYRRAQKAYNLSTAFVGMLRELRRCFDAHGFAHKPVIAVGDGSFCNQTTFRQGRDRTVLLTRARKDLRLCCPEPGPGPRYYGKETFTPQEVYQDATRPWQEARIFHGGKYRRIRYKEVGDVLWWRGGGRRRLRLLVLAPTTYRKTKAGRRYYREKAYLLCDENKVAVKALLQAYFDRWEIEINHRSRKEHPGSRPRPGLDRSKRAAGAGPDVGHLQFAALLARWRPTAPSARVPLEPLPKWRRAARRPSCQDLVTLLRQQLEARPFCQGTPSKIVDYPTRVQTAVA